MQGKIHISQATADALVASGKGSWLIQRPDKIVAKGKGELQTYFIKPPQGNKAGSAYSSMTSSSGEGGCDEVDGKSRMSGVATEQPQPGGDEDQHYETTASC